jgi:hypothetical protein
MMIGTLFMMTKNVNFLESHWFWVYWRPKYLRDQMRNYVWLIDVLVNRTERFILFLWACPIHRVCEVRRRQISNPSETWILLWPDYDCLNAFHCDAYLIFENWTSSRFLLLCWHSWHILSKIWTQIVNLAIFNKHIFRTQGRFQKFVCK